MKIRHGFNKRGENYVCRLNKTLYGLKQSSWEWFFKLFAALINEGFKQSSTDYSRFTY